MIRRLACSQEALMPGAPWAHSPEGHSKWEINSLVVCYGMLCGGKGGLQGDMRSAQAPCGTWAIMKKIYLCV